MTDRHDCAADVHDSSMAGFHRCANRGRYQEDGAWWCGTHRPSTVNARQIEANARTRAILDADAARRAEADRITGRVGKPVSVYYDHKGRSTDAVVIGRDILAAILDKAGM